MKKLVFKIALILVIFLPYTVQSKTHLGLSLNHEFTLKNNNTALLKSGTFSPLTAKSTNLRSDVSKLSLNFAKHNFMKSDDLEGSFLSSRRFKYAGLWTFTSLNYLYADLVGLMDANLLNQYTTGTVNDIDITPGFLTGAGAYMQLSLANSFLPLVIKNDRALRTIQIVSGCIATVVQGATLFVGKPAPYYFLFSTIEMAATTYITIDAIRWKPEKKKKKLL